MIKLFATDLDGTLLNSKGEISPKNKAAFQEMVNNGVIPTISTGRMYSASKKFAEQLELDVPIITYNGALIKSVSGKIYYEAFIPPQYVKEIFEYCREHNYYYQTYKDDVLYFENYTDRSKDYEDHIGIKGVTVGDKINDLTEDVPKILIITSGNEESDKICADINKRFAGKVHAAKSMLHYVEVLADGVSKASGLRKLAELLNIDINEVMAIGDGNNDVPMLKVAGLSAVMGNAKDEVKEHGDVVVGHCDDDGVAEAVYKYVLVD